MLAGIEREGRGHGRPQQQHQGGTVLPARGQHTAQHHVQDDAVGPQQHRQEKTENSQPDPLRQQSRNAGHAGEGEDRVWRHHAGEASQTE